MVFDTLFDPFFGKMPTFDVLIIQKCVEKGLKMGQKGRKTHFLARARRFLNISSVICIGIECVCIDDCL